MYQAFVKVWKPDYGEYVMVKCSLMAWGESLPCVTTLVCYENV